VVGADLVPEATRPAVDHDADLAVPQPERLGRDRVVHVGDALHLEEVIAGTEAAHLAETAFDGPRADLVGIGVGHRPLVFAAQQIAFVAVAALDRVRRATGQDADQLVLAGQGPYAARAGAARDGRVETVHQRLEHGPDVARLDLGGEQPYPAGDVEADPAGRDHPAGRRVGGGHSADGEAVPPVHVRHGVRGAHDPR
jgi:hypothetical protein